MFHTMHTDSKIIDALGGTAEVARLCEITKPSVSGWRKTGIPRARILYLRAVRPDVFASAEHVAVCGDVQEKEAGRDGHTGIGAVHKDTSPRSWPRPLRTCSQGAASGASQTSALASSGDPSEIAASIGGAAETMVIKGKEVA